MKLLQGALLFILSKGPMGHMGNAYVSWGPFSLGLESGPWEVGGVPHPSPPPLRGWGEGWASGWIFVAGAPGLEAS